MATPDDAYAEDGLVQEAREEAEGSENAQTPSSEETQPREEITTDSDYSETATDDAQRDPVTFTSQPIPPYYYGDRWVHDGETYSCVNESNETFSESDWALIDDYVIPTATYSQATRTVEEYITDYSEESLTEYQQSGAVPYAVYDDGTEVQVTWADVHDPSTAGDEFVTEAEQVALANNQHFWQRSTNPDGAGAGAFVTDSEQTDFLTAAASGFPDLSNNKPWHNMLLNSTGMLFRRALNNLVSITRSAVAFYDGAGNAAANVLASFGATSAQIGKSSASHVVMDANGVRQYLATKLRSAITATGFDIYDTNGTTKLVSIEAGSGLSSIDMNGGLEIAAFEENATNRSGKVHSAWINLANDVRIDLNESDLDSGGGGTPAGVNVIGELGVTEDVSTNKDMYCTSVHASGSAFVDGELHVDGTAYHEGHNISLSASNIDIGSPPSSNTGSNARMYFYDSNDNRIAIFGPLILSDGRAGIQMIAYNIYDDYNSISAYVDEDGNRTYGVTAPLAFRNAIGATSGVFPRSAGGTGMSERTTGTVTRSGIGTDGTIVAYSNGVMNAVTAYGCKLKTALTAGSSVEIATLPEGYRPPTNMYAVVTSGADAGVGRGSITINSSGIISFHAAVAWSTNATIAFTVSWAK